MQAGVIAALKRRCMSRVYERALDLLWGDDTCKLYQFDVRNGVVGMSDISEKDSSTKMHNRRSTTNILQFGLQNSDGNIQITHYSTLSKNMIEFIL